MTWAVILLKGPQWGSGWQVQRELGLSGGRFIRTIKWEPNRRQTQTPLHPWDAGGMRGPASSPITNKSAV